MHIIVCIKQVPDSTQVKVDPVTGTLIRAGVPSIMNPYDHYALEQGLKLKEKNNAKLTVLCMGPMQAKAVLRQALALGADEAVLLSDRAFAGSDTWATSYALSMAIKKLGGADIILCGMMAIDGDTAQTGPAMANYLGIAQMTFCEEIEVKGKKSLRAKKLMDGGYEILEAQFPVLATMILPYGHELKYPSFPAIFNAQNKPLNVYTAADINADTNFLGLDGSPTRVDRVYAPKTKEAGPVFKGSTAEMADKLLEILKQENVIK